MRAFAWFSRLRPSPTGAMALAAAAFGLLAVFGIRGHVAEQVAFERERLAPHRPTLQVVAAKRDLAAGTIVDADTMAVRDLPADGLPGSVVRPEGFDAVEGGRLTVALKAGEPLIGTVVARPDATALAARVRSGVRAITIAVDEVNALSGMLQPGDRIDLLVSARPPVRTAADTNADVTVPLMQDVPILAVGRQFKASADAAPGANARPYTTITIEAEPLQAQKLIVAQRSGRLTAMLRNPEDRGAMTRAPMDIGRLLDAAPASAAGRRTEIIVGGRGALERQLQPAANALPHAAAHALANRESIQ